jgi:hypothetical protein
MCVPGVQAYAGAGVAAIAMRAMTTTHSRRITGCLADSLVNLDTDPFSLTANGLSQIVHFGPNDVVDRFAGAVDVLADRVRHVVNGERIDELFATITRHAVTAC